jgi:hypothetical protein
MLSYKGRSRQQAAAPFLTVRPYAICPRRTFTVVT